jgi:hypothetical protein
MPPHSTSLRSILKLELFYLNRNRWRVGADMIRNGKKTSNLLKWESRKIKF